MAAEPLSVGAQVCVWSALGGGPGGSALCSRLSMERECNQPVTRWGPRTSPRGQAPRAVLSEMLSEREGPSRLHRAPGPGPGGSVARNRRRAPGAVGGTAHTRTPRCSLPSESPRVGWVHSKVPGGERRREAEGETAPILGCRPPQGARPGEPFTTPQQARPQTWPRELPNSEGLRGLPGSPGLSGGGRGAWREGPDGAHPGARPDRFGGQRGALPCSPGGEAVNAEAIERLGGAERGKGAGI